MIEHDGEPTIASRRIDPLLEKALAAGGHLGDDVAETILRDEREIFGTDVQASLADTLRSEHPELD